MRNITKSLLVATSLATVAFAKPIVTPSGVITASKVGSINLASVSTSSSMWSGSKPTSIVLYPQTTIKLNDKKGNAVNSDAKAKMAQIQAVYSGSTIAFKLTWSDATNNTMAKNASDAYADGFATQIPVNYSDPKKLPYIGMGSDGRPVVVHIAKSIPAYFEPNGNKDVASQLATNMVNAFGEDLKKNRAAIAKLSKQYHKAFISEGFRSLTEIKDGSDKSGMSMTYDAKTKKWTAVIAQSLSASSGAVPVAFAIWDGSKYNRGGVKNLSSWTAVKLQGKSGGEALIAELTSKPKGDAKAGQVQVEAMCVSCHTTSATKVASSPYMAPGLKNIGGYTTSAYLAESIKDPSAVIVPGYNRNAHKNFKWYELDAKTGKRTSTMPPMMTDDKSINDAVAYLKTLKAEVEK
jgi:complex iron-sulfur molybdoenzyme family reductase subunit gamma